MEYICSLSAFDWVCGLLTTKNGWKCLLNDFRLLQVAFTWLKFFRKRDPEAIFDIKINSSFTYAYIRLYDADYGLYRYILRVSSYDGCKLWQDPRTLIVYKYYNGSIYRI